MTNILSFTVIVTAAFWKRYLNLEIVTLWRIPFDA